MNTSTVTYSTDGDSQSDALQDVTGNLAEQLNDEFRNTVLPVTIFVGFEVVLGFLGNMLVIYVFLFHYHVCNFRYFVLCLSFIDVTSSVTTMLGEMVTQLYWYVYPLGYLCKVKSFFNVFTVSAEALCLLTIGFDRYRKICRPLGWQIKPRIAMYLCCAIYVTAFIMALPVALFWGIHSHTKLYKNVTINVTICEKDRQFENTNYPFMYSITLEAVLSICLILMFGLYVFVARKLLLEKRMRAPLLGAGPQMVITAPAVPTPVSRSSDVSDVTDVEFTSCPEIKNKNKGGKPADGGLPGGYINQHELSTTLPVPEDTNTNTESDSRTNDTETETRRPRKRGGIGVRVQRNTLIMFILTTVFIVTTILYLTLLSFIARSDDILKYMSDKSKAVYFFFFRLYFINHVINPIIYGILDSNFRRALTNLKRSIVSKYN